MYQALTPKGVSLPNGFAITAKAYFHYLETVGIRKNIKAGAITQYPSTLLVAEVVLKVLMAWCRISWLTWTSRT
jgi:phosphoenolpyruvate synthase/pyruvate phosphate dikinase